MTKKTTVKSLLFIAAASLGAATAATAQSASSPSPTTTSTSTLSERYGMLGARYAGLDYGYTHIHDSGTDNLNGFALRYNQPLEPGFDFGLGYEWARSNDYAGIRAKQEEVTADLTLYTDMNGMRPYIQPGVGYTRTKAGPGKDDSFLWFVGTGVEFQLMRPWTITPYVQFADATEYSGTTWNFGVKSDYRFNQSWGVHVDLKTDDDRNSGFAAGVNYHF